MNDVTVTGVEDGALILESRSGERFRLVIDEVLRSHVRRARTQSPRGPRVSPREIQAHLRAGLSATDVSELTGASLETVERFEGPVLAELDHTVSSALSVAVVAEDELPEDVDPTFGEAIRHRIEGLDASDERWSAWKDQEHGWHVKLSFTAGGVEHDARWAFDPKRHALTPVNEQATLLSRPGSAPSALIPRLRAVDTPQPDEAFAPDAFVVEEPAPPVQPRLPKAARDAINRAESEPSNPHDQTADLLEALRRRRGERESAPQPEQERPERSASDATTPAPPSRTAGATPITGANGAQEGPRESASESPQGTAEQEPRTAPSTPLRPRTAKKGRAALPSWDEIVFGAKPDDD